MAKDKLDVEKRVSSLETQFAALSEKVESLSAAIGKRKKKLFVVIYTAHTKTISWPCVSITKCLLKRKKKNQPIKTNVFYQSTTPNA